MVGSVCFFGVNGASLWAADAAGCAGYLVESALGRYSSGLLAAWSLPFDFDAVEASSLLPDHPNVWSDGSLVLDKVTSASSGAGFFAHQSVNLWDGFRWGQVDRVQYDDGFPSCRGFCSVPGPPVCPKS